MNGKRRGVRPIRKKQFEWTPCQEANFAWFPVISKTRKLKAETKKAVWMETLTENKTIFLLPAISTAKEENSAIRKKPFG